MEAYEYDAYGRHTVRRPGGSATEVAFDATDDVVAGGASAHGNPFGYTGQRFDAETGLMYYKNRYYSPELGRFTSRDPLGAWFDPVNKGNAMAYVGNRVTSMTDPSGLCAAYHDCLDMVCRFAEEDLQRARENHDRMKRDARSNRAACEGDAWFDYAVSVAMCDVAFIGLVALNGLPEDVKSKIRKKMVRKVGKRATRVILRRIPVVTVGAYATCRGNATRVLLSDLRRCRRDESRAMDNADNYLKQQEDAINRDRDRRLREECDFEKLCNPDPCP